MIKLHVQKYCHNCSDFEPDVTKDTRGFYTGYSEDFPERIERTDTYITCKHAARCESMFVYIRDEMRD